MSKLTNIFGTFGRNRTRWRCRRLERLADVADRQKRVTGYSQTDAERTVVLSVGAGGLGSETVKGLVQKGYGRIHVCDFDTVATTDLNRQEFTPRQIGRGKAISLCENLQSRGFLGTELIAHSVAVQDLDLDAIRPDVVFCGVDMQIPTTRLWLCQTLYNSGTPCVFSAVSRDASCGYVFVQEPGKACWACVFKPEFEDATDVVSTEHGDNRCPGTPAIIDVLKAVSGLALHAIDSLVMPSRYRDWNYRVISLTQGERDSSLWVEPRPECPVCGSPELTPNGEGDGPAD